MANVLDTTLAQWQRIMRVNADGYFLGCQYGVRAMQARGGSIINMSSVAAIGGLPQFCAYSASKGAVTALTRHVAAFARTQGLKIRCNSIHPDGIATPMLDGLPQPPPGTLTPEREATLAERMCSPADVAELVLFLASDASRRINGAELRIDNGQMILGVA
jgi:3(or 17)beta-hydroxysteroid dehydrogenase